METENQEMANQTTFILPIKNVNDSLYGYSDLEYLQELGATFEEHHYEKFNKHFVSVTLPEGLYLDEEYISGNFKYRVIVDEQKNNRGRVLVRVDNMNVANVILSRRFRVMNKPGKSGDLCFEHVFFGNEDIELIDGGTLAINVYDRSSLYIHSQRATMVSECERKADELYPLWRNPLAYWDEIPTVENGQKLTRKVED